MLERIWKKIIRREPYTFWDIPAFLLWLISFLYRAGFALRRRTASETVKVAKPVLSIGNITVGGSGKTPMVALLAQDLSNAGVRVGVVSSGYGRTETTPFIEPGYKVQQMEVAATSDEIMQLAHQVPEVVFSVDTRKVEAARSLAATDEVDVILVDDGFQHFDLERDIDLVTYDAGLKRQLLKPFPYGMLRESKRALARADIIVITRAKFAMDIKAIRRELARINPKAQIYQAAFEAQNIIGPDREMPVKYIEDKAVFLFAGVGNFRSLERQVLALSADLDCALELSDHQVYDVELLKRIKRMADRHDSDLILTTFKDWVKVKDFDFDREFYYLDLAIDLDPGEERLLAHLMQELKLLKQDR